jgi:hypothetical protein
VAAAAALEAAVNATVRRCAAAATVRRHRFGARGATACAAAIVLATIAPAAAAAVRVLVVAGLGGEAAYTERFEEWSQKIAAASATTTGDAAAVTRLTGDAARASAIEKAFRDLAAQVKAGDQAVVVLIGHGSHDGSDYRLNLPGPDLTATQLGALLDSLPATVPQLVVNATSASGGVVDAWQRPHRAVVAATRSAGERNATRFAGFWAEALASDGADRDKDGAVTAAEAFEYANRRVADSFKSDAAIATEHARSGGADLGRFVVARLGPAAMFSSDAQLTALRDEQTQAEARLAELRGRKATLPPDQYYETLEPVLVEIARLGTRIDARLAALGLPTGGTDAKR